MLFRSVAGAYVSSEIPFDATAAQVKAALELLPTITTVAVAFSTGLAACSGAGTNRAGLGSETCDPDATGVVESTFSRDVSANMQFETTNDWVPTQHVGPVGTMAKPGFAWLAAAGDATGKGATNCITVTMIPSVAMTSPSTAAMTDITISGLTGSDTADSSSLAIFAGGGCSKTP